MAGCILVEGKLMLSALSFWQPYAWFIVNGYADVDSRLWAPQEKRIGTTIAIHASKRILTRLEYVEFEKIVKNLKIKNYPKSPRDFDYGAIVGTVNIVGVTKRRPKDETDTSVGAARLVQNRTQWGIILLQVSRMPSHNEARNPTTKKPKKATFRPPFAPFEI